MQSAHIKWHSRRHHMSAQVPQGLAYTVLKVLNIIFKSTSTLLAIIYNKGCQKTMKLRISLSQMQVKNTGAY